MNGNEAGRILPGWQAGSQAVARELAEWRTAHPKAALADIDRELLAAQNSAVHTEDNESLTVSRYRAKLVCPILHRHTTQGETKDNDGGLTMPWGQLSASSPTTTMLCWCGASPSQSHNIRGFAI